MRDIRKCMHLLSSIQNLGVVKTDLLAWKLKYLVKMAPYAMWIETVEKIFAGCVQSSVFTVFKKIHSTTKKKATVGKRERIWIGNSFKKMANKEKSITPPGTRKMGMKTWNKHARLNWAAERQAWRCLVLVWHGESGARSHHREHLTRLLPTWHLHCLCSSDHFGKMRETHTCVPKMMGNTSGFISGEATERNDGNTKSGWCHLRS